MKKLAVIALMFVFATSCNTSDDESFPVVYDLLLDLNSSDGEVFDDGEVQLSYTSNADNADNEDMIFRELGVFDNPESNDIPLFGFVCNQPECEERRTSSIPFASTSGGEGIKDLYFYIHFPNENSKELRIRQVQEADPFSIDFTYFIDEEEVSIVTSPGQISYLTVNE